MPAKRVRMELSYQGIGEVMRSDKVRRHLASVAQGRAGKARAFARLNVAPAFADSIRVEEGTRSGPDRRPYARIIGDHPDKGRSPEALEWGDAGTDRLRILGRAARVRVRG
ncbi:hypothetical protein [Streptomonospora litoralis]|uniref:Uncharacterized protein n=1 Tax=Streptomonospora litoralis TaxID=2498135 RepID=A0A4P6PYQ6_9ACTN|nr:hypothetical protein [Streptomonospora litoralis]QBI53426.1 hypothetical protein EKD16_08160 [Streptomonospora litoralis]